MSSSNLVLACMIYSGSCRNAQAHDREYLALIRWRKMSTHAPRQKSRGRFSANSLA